MPDTLPFDVPLDFAETVTATARLSFRFAMRRFVPPWLRRTVGGAIMDSLGVPVETLVDRCIESVKIRFPSERFPDALAYIGRDRRIPRGPNEIDYTYSARLRLWWDAHLTRGGPYALLEQMYAFFQATDNPTIAVVGNSGIRHVVDPSGNITRDEIGSAGWTGDGEHPSKWARIFVIFQLSSSLFQGVSIYTLTDTQKAIACAVPVAWNAAHIERIYIRLLPSDGILWGYPETLEWGDAGRTWGGDLGVAFTC